MILPDVNLLVYAHREELDQHAAASQWLTAVLDGDSAFGLADLVLSGFIRIVTHPRAFPTPTPIAAALRFVDDVRDHPHRVTVAPGPRHFAIFAQLCASAGATGNRVPDAYLAALAIESGSEWLTTDRGFARYPGLRWRDPLATAGPALPGG